MRVVPDLSYADLLRHAMKVQQELEDGEINHQQAEARMVVIREMRQCIKAARAEAEELLEREDLTQLSGSDLEDAIKAEKSRLLRIVGGGKK